MYILAYILRNLEVAFLTNILKFTYIDIYFNIILNELSKCFYSFPQGRKDCSSVIERIAKEKSQIASHLGHKSYILMIKAILMTDISTLPQPCSSKVGTSPSSPRPPPGKDMLGQTNHPWILIQRKDFDCNNRFSYLGGKFNLGKAGDVVVHMAIVFLHLEM